MAVSEQLSVDAECTSLPAAAAKFIATRTGCDTGRPESLCLEGIAQEEE